MIFSVVRPLLDWDTITRIASLNEDIYLFFGFPLERSSTIRLLAISVVAEKKGRNRRIILKRKSRRAKFWPSLVIYFPFQGLSRAPHYFSLFFLGPELYPVFLSWWLLYFYTTRFFFLPGTLARLQILPSLGLKSVIDGIDCVRWCQPPGCLSFRSSWAAGREREREKCATVEKNIIITNVLPLRWQSHPAGRLPPRAQDGPSSLTSSAKSSWKSRPSCRRRPLKENKRSWCPIGIV